MINIDTLAVDKRPSSRVYPLLMCMDQCWCHIEVASSPPLWHFRPSSQPSKKRKYLKMVIISTLLQTKVHPKKWINMFILPDAYLSFFIYGTSHVFNKLQRSRFYNRNRFPASW